MAWCNIPLYDLPAAWRAQGIGAQAFIAFHHGERIAIFEDMNRLFGERLYILPTTYTLWGIIASPFVPDIAPLPLPDGGETFPVISGSHSVTQMWCEGGVCEG